MKILKELKNRYTVIAIIFCVCAITINYLDKYKYVGVVCILGICITFILRDISRKKNN